MILPGNVGNVFGRHLTETVGWAGLTCICLPTLMSSIAGAAAGFSVQKSTVFIRAGVTLAAGSDAGFEFCSLK